MLDPTAVGANLTPEQQKETMADLVFFMDEFGSTRAVRDQLQAQASDIERLQKQVWQLLGSQSDTNARQQEEDQRQEHTQSGNNNATKRGGEEPEHVDDIMINVDFFLRTFGSTRAVRSRLQSQSQLIAGLKCTVNWFQELRKSGKPGLAPQLTSNLMEKLASALQQDAVVRVGGETKGTRTVRGKHVKAEEAVNAASHHRDDDKASSPSAAHIKASQKEVDVVLKLLSPVRKERGAQDERGGLCLQSATNIASLVGTEFVNSSVVTAYLNALKCVNEVCAEARSLNSNNSSDPVESPKQIKGIHPISKENVSVTNNEKTNISAGKEPASKFKYTCSQAGCSSRVQVNGLCYRHGGYYTCREDGCDRKAITRQLCRLHGGGSLCHVPHCTKLIVSGGNGFCATHARDKGALAKYKCKVQGCTKTQVSQGFCHRHSSKSKVGQTLAPPNPGNQTSSSSLAGIPRGHHETCKVTGCMKWVKRDGDASEFCDKHRHVFTSQEPENSVAGAPDATTTRYDLCQELACTNHAKNYGPKKGYCFRHGGGLPCTQPNCNKQRQRNGLCAAHGGYYECKVEGCKKRVAARGFCRSHCQESLSVSNVDRELQGFLQKAE